MCIGMVTVDPGRILSPSYSSVYQHVSAWGPRIVAQGRHESHVVLGVAG